MNDPLICEFRSGNGNLYVYDACTNYTYPIEEVDKYVIDNYHEIDSLGIKSILESPYSWDKIKKSYTKIHQWVKSDKAFFTHWDSKSNYPKNLPTKFEYERLLANVKMLTLEISQGCNLRCKYCVFSGNFKHWRQHKNVNMTWKVAKQSIDYFLELINSPLRTSTFNGGLSFFGGEPLLNYPLIEKCVNYFSQKSMQANPIFAITTNGTLLDRDSIKFLIDHSINLTISLDGPKSEHNKNRVFSNGKGSFESVYKMLGLIYQLDKNYFKSNLAFNIVHTPSTNMKDVVQFFTELMDEFEFRPILTFSFVNTLDVKENIFSYDEECSKIYYELKDEYIQLKKSNIEVHSYYYCLERLFKRDHSDFYYRSWTGNGRDFKKFLGGQCYPGGLKIYVESTGTFLICERINNNFVIGNCKHGVDYNKAIRILDRFSQDILNECNNCYCVGVCKVCAASVAGDNKFNKKGICDEMRDTFKNLLIEHYTMLEQNQNAWNHELLSKA